MSSLLGIDTGGTYTDAVVMDESGTRVHATAKVPTTHHDLVEGIRAVIAELPSSPETIGLVSLSTTLATNALVERHGEPVCLIAAGVDVEGALSSGRADGDVFVAVPGGHDALGTELVPLDHDEVRAIAAATVDRVGAYAVVSQFSVRNPVHELAIAKALGEVTGRPVTCSHELSSRLDGPRRALTTLLNARLIAVIAHLESAVRTALVESGISAPLMIVRGDGSLASADLVSRRPIETILSGPAASVIGAQHLAGGSDRFETAIVVDIGGTTTDIAVVDDGCPTTAVDGAEVGGHRTMVDAIDLTTHGLGGDSEVSIGNTSHDLVLGPERAVPLCMLADDRPELVTMLAAQLAGSSLSGQGRFVVAVGSRLSSTETMDDDGRRMVASLAATDGLAAEIDLVGTSRARRTLDGLRRRGLVRIGTLTPTDAAVLLGHAQASEQGARAARLCAELIARRPDERGVWLASGAIELAGLVEARLIERSADHVLAAALRADGFDPEATRHPVVRAGVEGHRGVSSVSVGLAAPVIAVGASAATYYPAIAKRLGVTSIVPEHAEVGGAVGAVVGRVKVQQQLTISRPRAGRYEIHGIAATDRDDVAYGSVDDARRAGEEYLAVGVGRLAAEAGADKAEIAYEWSAKTAMVEGRELLVEATLVATATGRPRTAR